MSCIVPQVLSRPTTFKLVILSEDFSPSRRTPIASTNLGSAIGLLRLAFANPGERSLSMTPQQILTLPSESVSHNWLYFVVVVAVDKWEAAFCFPLIHSLFSSVARRQLAIAAVLRFQSCSNCVGLT